jgi:hypothetical protein
MTQPQQTHPSGHDGLVELSTKTPIWDRFFTIAPLVLTGTREADGRCLIPGVVVKLISFV